MPRNQHRPPVTRRRSPWQARLTLTGFSTGRPGLFETDIGRSIFGYNTYSHPTLPSVWSGGHAPGRFPNTTHNRPICGPPFDFDDGFKIGHGPELCRPARRRVDNLTIAPSLPLSAHVPELRSVGRMVRPYKINDTFGLQAQCLQPHGQFYSAIRIFVRAGENPYGPRPVRVRTVRA